MSIQALESVPGLKKRSMRDNLTPAKLMVMASISIMTVASMKVNGKKITTMDSGFIPTLTAEAMRATTGRVNDMVLAPISILTRT